MNRLLAGLDGSAAGSAAPSMSLPIIAAPKFYIKAVVEKPSEEKKV